MCVIMPNIMAMQSAKPLLTYDDFSIFPIWRLSAILDLLRACLDHPQKAFGGLYHFTTLQNFVGIDAAVSITRMFFISRVWFENACLRPKNWDLGDLTP